MRPRLSQHRELYKFIVTRMKAESLPELTKRKREKEHNIYKMEKEQESQSRRMIAWCIVVLFSTAAFSCCIAAEFNKVKPRELMVDGSLCSLPRTPAFGLGIAAMACLSVSHIFGTILAATSLCSSHHSPLFTYTSFRFASVCPLLLLSWVSYGMGIVMMGTAASMSGGQEYGEGWMDGECYLVKKGVFAGAAVLVALTALCTLAFTSLIITCPNPNPNPHTYDKPHATTVQVF